MGPKPKATTKTKTASTSAAKSNTKPKIRPGTDYLGCNLTPTQKGFWCNLTCDNQEILVSKFFDKDALVKLGLLEAVEVLLSRGGLRGFLDKSVPTYRRLTLEFLSTVEKLKDVEPKSIQFQLLNQTHVMTYNALRTAFGVDLRENEDPWASPSDTVANEFWYDINHVAISRATKKSSKLSHPAFRFVHRVITKWC